MSIVQTSTNKVIGEPLIVFDTYADEKAAVLPKNNTDFDVTIPTNLGKADCSTPGDCVLQWFWFVCFTPCSLPRAWSSTSSTKVWRFAVGRTKIGGWPSSNVKQITDSAD